MRLPIGTSAFKCIFVKNSQKERTDFVFYNNLKEECDRQEIKITPLVKECGGSTGTISNWKKGASPNSDIVMKIAVRLNVTTDFLLFGKTDSTTEQPPEEQRLIKAFRQLTDEGKRNVLGIAEMSAQNPQYQKYTDIPKEA